MKLIYFDLETTGLSPEKCQIAWLAAATEDGAREFEVKVRFLEKDAEPAALAMGWYSREAWEKEAVPLDDALARFDAWLAEVEPNLWSRKLAGHFAAEFDKPFLLAAYKKCSRKFPADFRVRDTMQLALWMLPHRHSYKLGDLYRDLCGAEVRKEEGAPGDVRATIAIVAEMRKRFGRPAEVTPTGHEPAEVGRGGEAVNDTDRRSRTGRAGYRPRTGERAEEAKP